MQGRFDLLEQPRSPAGGTEAIGEGEGAEDGQEGLDRWRDITMPKRPSTVTSPNTCGAGMPAAKTARVMRAS